LSEPAGAAWAVVVAAGEGRRMRAGALAEAPRKPFLELSGRAILLRTLDAVAACKLVERTVVAVAPDDVVAAEELIAPERERLRVAAVVAGGARRQETVRLALGSVPEDIEIVAVHDGVRPFVTADVFSRAIQAARRTGAACVSLPVKETLKRVADEGVEGDDRSPAISATLDRSGLWAAQTPQAFRARDLRRLLDEAAQDGTRVTDDAQLFDQQGLAVEAVRGDARNIKITTPEDLALAEAMFAGGARGFSEDMRVGTGLDCHPLTDGRRLVVCGVELESPVGGAGHSDADAAAHAAIDALLGACAMGDIGTLFPDSDPAFKDARSVDLLADVAGRVRAAGFEPRSLDVTVMLERPKLGPHVAAMRESLARATALPLDRVSVKAKSMNGIGPVGEGAAYAAQAAAVVVRRPGGEGA
jgi:2-C-methyl-D-erythritol 4-phosphate cytidylyltransferase/2-C-methyl-D-erythritol 2,4-cyclodiphosphate synthase